jgi:hypothetical protein
MLVFILAMSMSMHVKSDVQKAQDIFMMNMVEQGAPCSTTCEERTELIVLRLGLVGDDVNDDSTQHTP